MNRHAVKYISLLLILCLNAACSRHALHDAQTVVAQADSLWHAGQMYGIDQGDSSTLAQAYETLGTIPLPFREGLGLGFSYAHACYHYGRLLRKKDDPVSAMQVFINATHSHTRDYHILGRIYSNMGDLCHLAGDFPLSYDMFEKSGEMYQRNGDTLLYYYLLNDMAFELAEQGKKDSTLLLIDEIEKHCTDRDVLRLTLGTKAVACKKAAQYDSVLFYTSQLLQYNNDDSFAILNRAQAYSFLGRRDSAVYYAKKLMTHKNELYTQNGALYILTNDDETKDKESIRETAAARADIQKLIEIQQGKLSQATQLLELDLNRKPDFRWLYATCITILLIGSFLLIYLRRKHRQYLLLSQQVEEFAKEASIAKEENEQLTNRYQAYQEHALEKITHTCALLLNDSNMKETLCWTDYNKMCSFIDRQFYMLASKLRQKYSLNETEVRLCVLVLIGLSRAQIAQTLPYALNSVGKLKDQTAKKLGSTGKNLHDFLVQTAVEK